MPFRIGKIASIAKLHAAMMHAGDRVPPDGLRGWCCNPISKFRRPRLRQRSDTAFQERTMVSKTLAIVGAGPGLGLSLARRFGRDGYRAALIARNRQKLDGLVDQLGAEGIEAAAFVGDVTDSASVASALEQAQARFGAIDVLEYSPIVIPTDMSGYAPLEVTALAPETARRAFETMALGAVAAVHAVLPAMRERGSGAIVITTGISAIGFIPMIGAWGMAGAAARNYARNLHVALSGSGVFAGSVSLGVQIQKGDEHGDPDRLAERYFDFLAARDTPELVINHMPEGLIALDNAAG
jgi:NAD(P)-dependent dehydrogenase (short-subunit alcohol dehydrogenase family)